MQYESSCSWYSGSQVDLLNARRDEVMLSQS